MTWKEVKLEILGMAGAFNINVNEATLGWYNHALSHLDPENVMKALRIYARTTKQQRLPTPMQLEELLSPRVNPQLESINAVSRITEAVSHFGYMRGEEARLYIGDLGWVIVLRFGGWAHVCENLGVNLNLNSTFAQMRDTGTAILSSDMGYQIPIAASHDPKLLELSKNLIKKLE